MSPKMPADDGSRVAIVTGGASGIGRCTVDRLRAAGVRAVSFDVRQDDPVDVSDPRAVGAALGRVRESHGPVDVVVNCAGIGAGGPLGSDRYLEEWQRSLAVNVTGAMLVVRGCIDDLTATGWGRVVNIASTEALGAQRGTGPYTVAKHGLLGFTRSLAVEYGRTGMTANCVCPGPIDTPLVSAIPPHDKATFARRHVPVGRYGSPDEVAYLIVCLADPAASYINGAVVTVDGGMTAMN
jgi:3-oxoacyl-[acyl-carrier protein] reductase